MKFLSTVILVFSSLLTFGQEDEKIYGSILLDSVVIIAEDDFNIESFISRIREDSSFYQAFKNLRYYPHLANGKIWVFNRKNNEKASEEMNAIQYLNKNKMWQTHEIESSSGKIKTRKGEYKFTTAQMYYDVFFPIDTVPVSTRFTSIKNEKIGNSKKARYKHDLKIMMFNPGEDVEGIPIVGKKMSIFDDDMIEFYEYRINSTNYNGKECYVFSCIAKPDYGQHKTVIKSLTTYFDKTTMNVLKRESHMKYQTLLFQFDVKFLVEITNISEILVPSTIKYNGYWDIPFKTQEILRFKIENKEFTIGK